MLRILLFLFVGIFSFSGAAAQKQLLVLKREKVVLRLYPGDEIVFRLKNGKRKRTSYVNNIFDTAFMAHNDTIPFRKIDRIYFPQTKLYNVIGGALVVGGAGFFLIDQFNEVVVQGNKANLDNRVSTISLSSIAAGLPLMLIRKKSQRIRLKYRLLMVKEGSIFYKPDSRGFESPYIPGN
jgi:hypothetical protein